MTNFGNWKGSRAGKIKLHLVRPLHILKSPGKPTKNILGLKTNKRHVCMHIHIQAAHQLILFLFKDSTLTLTQREDLWLQFCHSLHQMLSFFHHQQGGRREGCHHLRFGGSSETQFVCVCFQLYWASHLYCLQSRPGRQTKQIHIQVLLTKR